ncbi:MAG: type III pantothenate kinase [Candidatus Dormibacteraceae bacterium]
MLLAVDAGNTNVVMGLYDGERLAANWRVTTPPTWTGDEVAMLLFDLFALRGLELGVVDGVVIGSVVPNLTPAFEEVAHEHLHVDPVVVGPGVRTGIRLAIENPKEVGADRIANTLAAFRKYGGPAIVIDLGTAVTYDAVSATGDYLGGAIAPGVGISLDALVTATAKLVRVELVAPDSVIGRSTASAIQSGVLWGFVGQIEGMVRRMTDELGGSARVIATGGQAAMVAGLTHVIDSVDPDLTLEGLRLIYIQNLRDGGT